jgi:hypothetical protein
MRDRNSTFSRRPGLFLLRWSAFLAAIAMTATGEYTLGRQLGFGWGAIALPVMIDLYAMYAMRTHNKSDVHASVALMIVAQALAHLVEAGIVPVNPAMIVLGSAVAPIIFALVHADPKPGVVEAASVPVTATTEPVPEQQPALPARGRRAETGKSGRSKAETAALVAASWRTTLERRSQPARER